MICRRSTYKAIVDCLCNLLPEAQSAENNSAFRTQPERNALYVIHHTLGFDVAKALEAGVISRWLVQYPFGGANASKFKKKRTIKKILENVSYYEDSDFGRTMRAMLFCMSKTPLLRQEMVAHGLLDVPKGGNISVGVLLAVSSGLELIMCRMTGTYRKHFQAYFQTLIGHAGAFWLERVIDQGKKVLRSKLCGEEGGKPWYSVRLGDLLKGLIL